MNDSRELSNPSVPQDFEAEQAVLGSIIYRNDLLVEVASMLTSLSFYAKSHQQIFRAMLELEEESQPIDEVLIGDKLKSWEQLEVAGGYAYLAELVDCVPASGNVTHYAKIVLEHSTLRDLISTATEIAKKSHSPDRNIGNLLAEAESKLSEIATRSTQKSYAHIKDVLATSFEVLEKNSANQDEVTGLPTGFSDLDKLTSGLQPSDLIILAARPSMGKTAFALNLMKYAALKSPHKGAVVFFSLEMSKEQLATRLLSTEAKVDSNKLRTGNLDPEDWDKLALATDTLSQAPMYINDTPGLSPYELVSICKQLKKELEGGVSMVMVDYLQLMRGNRPNLPREQEISEISRNLKGLAKDLAVPVVALSQLNRSLESRSDKRPVLSDLRESGAIEQDADIIMFIYRDEVYNEDTADKGIAEILISKHRNGSTGKIPLAFIGKYTAFGNLAKQDHYEWEGLSV